MASLTPQPSLHYRENLQRRRRPKGAFCVSNNKRHFTGHTVRAKPLLAMRWHCHDDVKHLPIKELQTAPIKFGQISVCDAPLGVKN